MSDRSGDKEKQLFEVRFDELPLQDIVDRIERQSDEYIYIVTPNVDHIVRIYSDPGKYLHLYADADVSVCDSRILQLLSKLLGKPIENVVPGSDLTVHIFQHVLDAGDRIVIFGSDAKSVQFLGDRYGLKNVFHFSPPMGFIDNPSLVEESLDYICGAEPDYLFLAVGSPRQEIIAHKLKQRLNRGTAFCIGASIDFLTGRVVRAPERWQKMRLEWLYRFLQEPKRLFKRYFWDGLKIIPIFIKELLK